MENEKPIMLQDVTTIVKKEEEEQGACSSRLSIS
jgi:hypothetical protein